MASSLASVTPTWLNLGPASADYEVNTFQLGGVDSGRIGGLVVSPVDGNTMYAATAGGGVWKTANGGQSWLPISDSLPDLFVGAIEMDPTDSNVLYVGLGDFDASAGAGVGAFLQSPDGGQSWSAPAVLSAASGSTLVTATYIKQLLASPYTPGLLLAATDVGLFRSVNHGATWSVALLPGAGSVPTVWSIAWTGGEGFVASVNGNLNSNAPGVVYFSRDSGSSWSPATTWLNSHPFSVGRISLAAAPANRATVYALAADATQYGLGDIYRSLDGGASWTSLNALSAPLLNPNSLASDIRSLFGDQASYDQLLLVSPTDPNVFYFGGTLALANTTDGGNTYSQLTSWLGPIGQLPYVHADFQYGTIDSSGNIYAGTDGGIFRSSDGGVTWTSGLNVGIVSHLVYSVGSSLANRNAVIGGLQDDGTRVRSGATSTFNQVLGGDGFGSHIHASNANFMLGSQYNTLIFRSSDGGASWQSASAGISGAGVFYTKLVAGRGDPSGDTVYTFTSQNVYVSTDYASSWTVLGSTGLPTSGLRNLGAAASNPLVLGVVAGNGPVSLSSDGGLTWNDTASLPNSSGYLSSVTFDSSNANIVYATSVALVASASHVWKSVDGGSSWTALDGAGSGFPAGIPVNEVVSDPTNSQHLYAGTLFGLYQSSDGGATWSVAGSGLPLVEVTDVYVAPDASLVRISTYGRGFWELTTAAPFQGITVSPGALPGGSSGTTYPTQTITASGGTPPYSFSVTAGSLPGGLVLGSPGALGGTPNTVGSFTFRVTAIDSTPTAAGGPLTGSQVYVAAITNPPSPVTLTPTSVPNGVAGVSYPAQSFAASGGTAPYSFTVTGGALPSGLSLTAAGALAGVPTAAGTNTFVVTVTDSTPASSGGPITASESLSTIIARTAQSISFATPPDQLLGSPDFQVSATASSGLTVTFSSLTPAICSVTGSSVQLIAPGTCTIAADQAGTPDYYAAAPEVQRSFAVLINLTPPAVASFTCDEPTPTAVDSFDCTLAFTQPVTGVVASDFTLSTNGISAASITGVTGSGAAWTVTVGTGRGTGTLVPTFTGGPDIENSADVPLPATVENGPLFQVDKGGTVIGTGEGQPDSKFGSRGYALFDGVAQAYAPAVAILPDGRRAAAGAVACDANTGVCGLELAQYLQSGTPDPSFGQSGRVQPSLPGLFVVDSLHLSSDGGWLVDGLVYSADLTSYGPFIGKFTASGNPDATFGANGLANLGFLPAGTLIYGVSIDAGGRPLLVGPVPGLPGSGVDVIVARLTPAGQPDPSFGTGGFVQLSISTTGTRNDVAFGVQVQSDGRILVSGRTIGPSGKYDFLLVRLASTGANDPSFGTNGIATAHPPGTVSAAGSEMALQSDGKTVVIGNADAQCAAVRFDSAGALDAQFGTGGTELLPSLQSCYGLVVQPDGKLLLTGQNFVGDVTYAAYLRLLRNGSPDPTFGTNGLLEISDYDVPATVAVDASGALVSALTVEDPADGVVKSYVVQLAAQLSLATTSLTASPSAASYGQTVTLTAAVTHAGSVAPTGTVAFQDGSTVVGGSASLGPCAPPTTSTVCASVSLPALAVGAHSFTAIYAGDGTFAASSSSPVIVAVSSAPAAVILSSSANPAAYGVPVTLTATVPAAGTGASIATGAVTFYDGATMIGVATLSAGSASVPGLVLAAGAHSIAANYAGDSEYLPASSAPFLQSVTAAASTTTIAASPGSSVFGQGVALTAVVSGASGTPAGQVTFYDASSALGTVALVAGQATLQVTTLSAGSHVLSARFLGSTSYAASTSGIATEVVAQAPITVTLVASPNPATTGHPITFTATLTPQFGGTASGSVTFSDAGVAIGSAPIVSNAAVYTTATLAAGTHPITAAFPGDGSFTAATSAVSSEIVNAAAIPTTTSLGSSANPALVGQSVTYTATVTGGSATPSGSAVFKSGTTTVATVALVAGQASYSAVYSTTGTRSISAIYVAVAPFLPSTSPALSEKIQSKLATTTALSSAPNPSVIGQAVTLTAIVSVAGTVIPDGSLVTFVNGSSTLGSAVTAQGRASLTTSALSVGTKSIKATFGGTATLDASTSTALAQVVGKQATATAISSAPNPSIYRQPVSFTASVTAAGPAPTGTVTFRNGTTALGQATLSGGAATIVTSTLAAGSDLITASYAGDTSSASSTSAAFPQTVTQAPTTLTLTSSANPASYGHSVTFTATVSTQTGTAAGPVAFTAGSVNLGTINLNGNGIAHISTSSLPRGVTTVTATLSATGNFRGSTGSLAQTVH